jgi:bifunctional UDP-N-acetylglucosamine pyrophosphorylase/glucosamine-1-phosphate N-acetyltransferase
MNSDHPKVLHTVLGQPLLSYPLTAAQGISNGPIVAVLGHGKAEVETYLSSHPLYKTVKTVEQKEQKGTGDAVRVGLSALSDWNGMVLILCGDVPLLTPETTQALIQSVKSDGMAMLTAEMADPTGYGRIVRDAEGRVTRIVEHKDASPEERALTEINAGIYVIPATFLRQAIANLNAQNAQGELYLTDVVEQAAGKIGVETLTVSAEEIAGVNDRKQLVWAEAVLQCRINTRWLRHATIRAPETAYIEPTVSIEPDAEIGRNVCLRGHTTVGRGATVMDGAILTDTHVGAGAVVKPYTVAERAHIGEHAQVGPFAHLRPGTELSEATRIGNFVETKNARIGKGSKANHLTYLGDATVGENVNIGAGTITCNYNGYEKRQTVIEDGAFIGSDTQLVAPVRVGERAIVAAGATVTQDVPPVALAISRVPQTHVAGYSDKLAARYKNK